MPSEWWRRLPAAQRREYERSDAISHVRLKASPALGEAVLDLDRILRADDLHGTERASQVLVNRICAGLGVPPVRVRVDGVRPHDRRGELHGLYSPAAGAGHDRITLWMRTAKRGDVVRTRTFLRTLLHEVCHHLDFALFSLPNSFHSKGFYQRESSLFRVIVRGTPLATPSRGGRDAEPAADAAASEGRPDDVAPVAPPDGPRGIDLLRAAAAAIAARPQGGA
ncbi:MAG: hypothetical protein AB1689_26490 [Thermodesulfobacteriota bacterium]